MENWLNMKNYYSNFSELLKEKKLKMGKIAGVHELNKPPTYIIINGKNKEAWYIKYSKDYKGYIYWFGVEREYLKKLSEYKGYVVFGCGSIKNIFKIPVDFLIKKLEHTSTALIDNNYKIHINEKYGEFLFKVPNGQEINIEKFRFK